MVLSLLGFTFVEPLESLGMTALCVFFLSLSAGCLYLTGLAYELESLEESTYALGSACVITGYRLGLLCAGAGALYLSSLWGWHTMFFCMAALLILGSGFILLQQEPYKSKDILQAKRSQWEKYTSLWQAFWHEIVLEPLRAFFQRSDWKMILFILLGFKTGDQMIKSMEGIFFLSLGFDKVDLATATKVWGLISTIIGAFLISIFLNNRNRLLVLCAVSIIHASTLICHCILTWTGKSFAMLYLTVALENLTSGMAMTAFISFLWSICEKRYAALQYTLLWSLFFFKGDLLGWAGGMLASSYSWNVFFLLSATLSLLIALGSLQLVFLMRKKLHV